MHGCAEPSSTLQPFFFFNDTATTEIYTLSLHDALPISGETYRVEEVVKRAGQHEAEHSLLAPMPGRSEEHTSELQSQSNLVCRLLLEKKKLTPSTSSSFCLYETLARLHLDGPAYTADAP